MINIMTRLNKMPVPIWVSIALSLIALIGAVDYFTGFTLSFSIFYLAPISFSAWFIGRRAGIFTAAACAFAWLLTLLVYPHSGGNALLPIWNLMVGVGLFGVVLVILVTLRDALDHERDLARTDSLTGIHNSRSFTEHTQYELRRSARYGNPFSLAYIDIDNFKAINDNSGHSTGDALLRTVAETIRDTIRPTDIVARLGGDEFAILFVEADYKGAQIAIRRVQKALAEATSLAGLPVTFSIGVVTCLDPVNSVEDLLKMADSLMYSVKRGSKNGFRHQLAGKAESDNVNQVA